MASAGQLCQSVRGDIGCGMVTSDQPQPLDLSIQTPQPHVVKSPASWPHKIILRSSSISDGESGDSGDHRDGSRSPSETLSVSLSVTPTPSDASVGDVSPSSDVSPRGPVTKRFLHKYQAEQTSKNPGHHPNTDTNGPQSKSQESLVNNKDLLSYGERIFNDDACNNI